MSRWERPSSDRLVAMIRTSLGEDAYEVAFADGRAMPMEQAIELVLELAAEIQAASPCPRLPRSSHPTAARSSDFARPCASP